MAMAGGRPKKNKKRRAAQRRDFGADQGRRDDWAVAKVGGRYSGKWVVDEPGALEWAGFQRAERCNSKGGAEVASRENGKRRTVGAVSTWGYLCPSNLLVAAGQGVEGTGRRMSRQLGKFGFRPRQSLSVERRSFVESRPEGGVEGKGSKKE
ncbi:hypothetical protein IF1G_03380 [Cordyceps javanica]|uniref:Uncharacterized protein n=1 Tax=Cordyceps javanica TaxID=43265 RepID=A0A545V7F0_9HYPO|nr:hypothetical protein IF1G_03380 [Cordyceps javanica]